MNSKPIEERLIRKIELTPDGCWRWTGVHNQFGYGMIRMDGKLQGVHRISWETFRGPVPDGLEIAHKCDVRDCINPEHLFAATHLENMVDMCEKGRHAHASHTIGHKKAYEIREDAKSMSMIKVAEKHGVTYSAVWDIVHFVTHAVDIWIPETDTHTPAIMDQSGLIPQVRRV